MPFSFSVQQNKGKIPEVVIVAAEDKNDDRKLGAKVVEHLKEHKIDAVAAIGDRSICRCTPYIIPIFSEQSFKDKIFFRTIMEVMTVGVDDNEVKVIPVLNGVSGEQLPNFMKWVVYLYSNETQLSENILAVIRGKNIDILKSIY